MRSIMKFYLRPLMNNARREHMNYVVHAPSLHKAAKSSDHHPTPSQWPHPIYVSHSLRHRKSTFLAHASTLPSPLAFPAFLDHLTSLSVLKRATHCMYAYRTTHPTQATVATSQDDGGESGSGHRLARLLELSGCENVVVVVSRWYGGIKLGSDRWKRISDVAKDALHKGGFTNKQEHSTATRRKCKKT